jgi:hypothetical protein
VVWIFRSICGVAVRARRRLRRSSTPFDGGEQVLAQLLDTFRYSGLRGLRSLNRIPRALLCNRGSGFGSVPSLRFGFSGLALYLGAVLGFLRTAAQIACVPFKGGEYSINRRRIRVRVFGSHARIQH